MPLPYQHLVGGGVVSKTPNSQAQPLSKDVANAPKAEPIDSQAHCQGDVRDEEDRISKQLSELQGELFESLKEDISLWINKTLGDVHMTADNFIRVLDTGVILCRVSQAIEVKAREAFQQGKIKETLPNYHLHCNLQAESGTWFARDNTANFLGWCRAYGMLDPALFDTEDLVTHHQERHVIYCLMELARLGYKFGLEPPSLICMEREIDANPTFSPPPPVSPPPPLPVEIAPKIELKYSPPPPAPQLPPTPPPPPPPPRPPRPPSPPIIQPSPDISAAPPHSPPPVSFLPPSPYPPSASTSSPSSRPPSSSSSSNQTSLESEVNRVTQKCKCQEYVNKLSEGVYTVFGKRVHIRLLNAKHLMVRVGGGWDTFENYLLHHDPIQVFEFHTNTSPSQHATHSTAVARDDFKPGAFNGYLVIRSRYKSTNFP